MQSIIFNSKMSLFTKRIKFRFASRPTKTVSLSLLITSAYHMRDILQKLSFEASNEEKDLPLSFSNRLFFIKTEYRMLTPLQLLHQSNLYLHHRYYPFEIISPPFNPVKKVLNAKEKNP